MLCSKIYEVPIIHVEHRAREDYESPGTRLGHRGEGRVEVTGACGVENLKVYSGRCCSYAFQHVVHSAFAIYPSMLEHGYAAHPGNHLPQQLEAFRPQLRGKEAHACDVAAWTAEAGDQSIGNGICHRPHDDGNRLRRPLGCEAGWRAPRYDHVNVQTDEVIRRARQRFHVAGPVLNRDVLALNVTAVLSESFPEGLPDA